MILLSFRRERRNFMACKRVGEQNIYFRDVYIIHLARSEREREKKHDRNAKAGERKSRKHHSTTSAPVCLLSFSALCSTAESSLICSHHQSWFHVLFQLTFTSALALTPRAPLELCVRAVGRESLYSPPAPPPHSLDHREERKRNGKQAEVVAWFKEEECYLKQESI